MQRQRRERAVRSQANGRHAAGLRALALAGPYSGTHGADCGGVVTTRQPMAAAARRRRRRQGLWVQWRDCTPSCTAAPQSSDPPLEVGGHCHRPMHRPMHRSPPAHRPARPPPAVPRGNHGANPGKTTPPRTTPPPHLMQTMKPGRFYCGCGKPCPDSGGFASAFQLPRQGGDWAVIGFHAPSSLSGASFRFVPENRQVMVRRSDFSHGAPSWRSSGVAQPKFQPAKRQRLDSP